METKRNISLKLTQEEYSFISEVAKQCAGDSTSGFSESMVLRALIKLLRHLEVDFTGAKTEEQLLQRLLEAIRTERT